MTRLPSEKNREMHESAESAPCTSSTSGGAPRTSHAPPLELVNGGAGKPLNHVETIRRLLKTVVASNRMHALLVTGPAGFGKSTAVDEALKHTSMRSAHLGSYSSPLNFYNFLYENAEDGIISVIDDTSGIYSDPTAMALLKAATLNQGKPRILHWGSTSGKAAVDQFEYRGKIIILCNSFPSTSDAMAVKSRAFSYKFEIGETKARALILEAAEDRNRFPNTAQAKTVAQFICGLISDRTLPQISYRTLEQGYELAEHNPADWQHLLRGTVSVEPEDPKNLVATLASEPITVREQFLRFERATGMKRRTFFKYRREMKLKSIS